MFYSYSIFSLSHQIYLIFFIQSHFNYILLTFSQNTTLFTFLNIPSIALGVKSGTGGVYIFI